jgi:hypothetical protein
MAKGNSGLVDGTNNILGTTDNVPVELRANNLRILRLIPNATSPNLLGGFNGNTIAAGAVGAVIGGGGFTASVNSVTDDYGVVAGGAKNQAGDNAGTTSDKQYATVSGGSGNTASGSYSSVPGGLQAAATNYGQQAFASGQFAAAGDAQGSLFVLRSAATGAGTVSLSLDGTGTGGISFCTINTNRTVALDIQVVLRSSNNQSAAWNITGVATCTGTTLTTSMLPATATATMTSEFTGARSIGTSTSPTLLGSGNKLYISAGVAAGTFGAGNINTTNFRWVATVRTTELGF